MAIPEAPDFVQLSNPHQTGMLLVSTGRPFGNVVTHTVYSWVNDKSQSGSGVVNYFFQSFLIELPQAAFYTVTVGYRNNDGDGPTRQQSHNVTSGLGANPNKIKLSVSRTQRRNTNYAIDYWRYTIDPIWPAAYPVRTNRGLNDKNECVLKTQLEPPQAAEPVDSITCILGSKSGQTFTPLRYIGRQYADNCVAPYISFNWSTFNFNDTYGTDGSWWFRFLRHNIVNTDDYGWSNWTQLVAIDCPTNRRIIGVNWQRTTGTQFQQAVLGQQSRGDIGDIDGNQSNISITATGPARFLIKASTRADAGTDLPITLSKLPYKPADWSRTWTAVTSPVRCSERILRGVWNGGDVTFTITHDATQGKLNWLTIDWDTTDVTTARSPRLDLIEWSTQSSTEKAANPKTRTCKIYVERSGVDGVDTEDLTNETFQGYLDQWPIDGPATKHGSAAAADTFTVSGLVEGRRYFYRSRKNADDYPCSEALILDVPTTDFRGMVIEATHNGSVLNAHVSIPADYGPGIRNDIRYDWTIKMASGSTDTGIDVWETHTSASTTSTVQNFWPVSRLAKITCTVHYGTTSKALSEATIEVPAGPPLRAPRFNGFSSFSAGADGAMGTASTKLTASSELTTGYAWWSGVTPSADVKETGTGKTRTFSGLIQGQKYYFRWTNTSLGNLLSEVRELRVPVQNMPKAITPVRLSSDRRIYSPAPSNASDEVLDNIKRQYEIDGSQFTAGETLIPPEDADTIRVRYILDGQVGAWSDVLNYQGDPPAFSDTHLRVRGVGSTVFATLDLTGYEWLMTLTWQLDGASNRTTVGPYPSGIASVSWVGAQSGTVTVTDGTSTATAAVTLVPSAIENRPPFDHLADTAWKSLLTTVGQDLTIGNVVYRGMAGDVVTVKVPQGIKEPTEIEVPTVSVGFNPNHTIQLGDLAVLNGVALQVYDRHWEDYAVVQLALAPLDVAPAVDDGYVWP